MLDNFTLVLFMWTIGAIGLLGLIVLLIVTVVTRLISKGGSKFSIVKGIFGLVCFVCFYLSLPYFIVPISLRQKDPNTLISYLKVAAAVAVVPSVKAEIYYDISSNYLFLLKEGQMAIDVYEKAEKIAGKPDKHYAALICIAYLWKNDEENVLKTCPPNSIAAFYLKNNDFETALNTSNDYISTLQDDDKKDLCFSRGIRAAINKKKGDKSEFNKDADFVKKECSYYSAAGKYVQADNLFDVYMPYGKDFKF